MCAIAMKWFQYVYETFVLLLFTERKRNPHGQQHSSWTVCDLLVWLPGKDLLDWLSWEPEELEALMYRGKEGETYSLRGKIQCGNQFISVGGNLPLQKLILLIQLHHKVVLALL